MKKINNLEYYEFEFQLRHIREYLSSWITQYQSIDPTVMDEIIIHSLWRIWGYNRLKDFLEQELKLSSEEANKKTHWAIIHKFEDEKLYDLDTKRNDTTSVK
jgi:hypothetical protein